MPTVDIALIQEALCHTDDFIIRELNMGEDKAVLLYLETMCDKAKIELSLLKQLQRESNDGQVAMRMEELLTATKVKPCLSVQDAVDALLEGSAIICSEAAGHCYSFDVSQQNSRSPEEPVNERSLAGNRDGFVEHLQTNLNLVRKHLSTGELRVRYFKLGTNAKRLVAMVWLDGTADTGIVNIATNRISSMSSSHDLHPGLIRKQLRESKYSIFPQTLSTERVDFAAALLARGRICVLCDRSSACLILPVSYYTFMLAADDLIQGTFPSLLMRMVRVLGLLFGLILPSLYITIVGFNYEVLPFSMVNTIKSSLENVPYPPIFEVFLMIMIFQLIAEATLRLPSTLAQMTGIVGGITISESLVQIGFVSNILIVIIALTTIGKFAIPSTELRSSTTMIQFALIIGATILGFYGMMFVFVIILIHFLALEPYGVPYCLTVRSVKR
ncbi:Spore germination protein A1 [Paenibacillus allorhizoplanae]|uniref:Spore germination protein A1 n=1 Tax=Paenibacillus allorhizoplanae TaxID=2905648 RepID=A0ABM9CY34_9BACL|nr:spore germination protein [Paenibacillus allorhizoplanae]CAH1226694.1 Spore germination protein A1 [Paenibacillus allorhizoplanae]